MFFRKRTAVFDPIYPIIILSILFILYAAIGLSSACKEFSVMGLSQFGECQPNTFNLYSLPMLQYQWPLFYLGFGILFAICISTAVIAIDKNFRHKKTID